MAETISMGQAFSRLQQAGGFQNAGIAGINQTMQSQESMNQEGGVLMKNALQGFKDGKISGQQMLAVYDQLKQLGVTGKTMDVMEGLFHNDSHARKYIEMLGGDFSRAGDKAESARHFFHPGAATEKLNGWVDEALKNIPSDIGRPSAFAPTSTGFGGNRDLSRIQF